MKPHALLYAAAAIALVATACNQAPAPAALVDTHDADVKTIGDIETQWNADWAAKDSDKLLAHYTDDAVLMAPGAEPYSGKDAIRNGLKPMLDDKALSLKFHATRIDVAKSSDLAYTQGTYQLTITDPTTHKPINDHGAYVTTYRKQTDGSWKAVADIASSSAPPAAPPKHKLL